jgi:hypothetical protein
MASVRGQNVHFVTSTVVLSFSRSFGRVSMASVRGQNVHFVTSTVVLSFSLRVCKHYGLCTHQLDLLFNSLIFSLFTFAAEVWGGASYNKYVSQIDKFVNRANRNVYTSNRSDFKATISNRDKKLWSRIINDDKNALHNLLSSKLNRPLRRRGHDFELPIVKTERFKNAFINRCIFNFI